MTELLDKLEARRALSRVEWISLLSRWQELSGEDLFERARKTRRAVYGDQVFLRGLIEFTNYCKNDCLYCGIRRGNRRAVRYRLTEEEILACCGAGEALGLRTFVLQGGEDPGFSDERIARLVSEIKRRHPHCAVTLSVGERDREVYRTWREAGADRYLLRHETADPAHYHRLHPPELSPERRKECLWTLKDLGYQVGAGFLVGSPYQTVENLADDLLFLKKLDPQMVGIGPFLPHHDTPFANEPAGSAELTVALLALVRLMLPRVLLPATTALSTAAQDGRIRGIQAGANVVMPNLSPESVRKNYLLYDNKKCTGDEAAEHIRLLTQQLGAIGCTVSSSRGDYRSSSIHHRKEPAS